MSGRERDSEGTRERILDTASTLFATHGYDAASTRILASAAHVNVATLAYHFGGKEGLYHAVLDRLWGRLAELPLPDRLPEPPEDRVRVVIAALYRWARRHREAVQVLLGHTLRHGGLPAPVRERHTLSSMARVREIVGELGLLDPAEAVLPLLSLNHLVARYAISSNEAVAPFAGGRDPESAVEDHLGDVAVALLRPWFPPPST